MEWNGNNSIHITKKYKGRIKILLDITQVFTFHVLLERYWKMFCIKYEGVN